MIGLPGGLGGRAAMLGYDDVAAVRDLTPDVLDRDGRMRVLPASYWAATTVMERAVFGNAHGIYAFPTVELVQRLTELIGGRTAIEICAGHGVLGQALGIPATDNRMQEDGDTMRFFNQIGMPPVRYGTNVIACPANEAVRRYRPQVVIGCWVMHQYRPDRHFAGGNPAGVDEADIVNNCEQYIVVGNEQVHRHSPLWERPHQVEYPDYLYSRALNGSREFLARWSRQKNPAAGGRR